jgi:cell division protein FtsZ
MLKSQIHGADFIIANTDVQALRDVNGATTVQIGSEITKGLGAGADPEKGRQAALEASEILKESIEGADMLFIAAGMGGGTGTGAAPVIAQIARDLGILTVAVVTKPFEFEGPERMSNAQEGIDNLEQWVDSLIVIPNSKLKEVYGGGESIFSSFENANDVLRGAVKGITEIITIRGFMNVDFADVKTVMSGMGKAMMGSGVSSGENRAIDAVTTALSSPLLDNIDLQGASGVLVNITSGSDLTTDEFEVIGSKIREIANEDAKIITGCIKEDDNIGDLRVTIIATGFSQDNKIDVNSSEVNQSTQESTTNNPSVSYPSNSEAKNDAITQVNVSQQEDQTSLDIPAFLRQQAD